MMQSNTAQNGATTTVDDGGPRDFREISGAGAPLRVCAFRFSDMSKAFNRRRLPNAGTYILALHASKEAYPGQSGNLCERLPRYLTTPQKCLAEEVFIFFAPDGGLDAGSRLHLEARLLDLIHWTGVYRPLNQARPHPSRLSEWEQDKLDRKLLQTLPLLPEIGCHFIDPNGSGLPLEHIDTGSGKQPAAEVPSVVVEKLNRDCLVAAGVGYTPVSGSEVELAYRDLWARGYQVPLYFCRRGPAEFVVAVGSEMRKIPGIVGLEILELRDLLVRTGTAVPIPGVLDRFWLNKPVAFRSRALAAAVLTGTENRSDTWRPLQADPPCVSAT